MHNPTIIEILSIAAVMFFMFVLPMLLSAPSNEDIARCMALTKYSQERCDYELNH